MASTDPEAYFVASRDKQGHSSSLRIAVPTGVMQSLAELVASRRVAHLKTTADCHRDALGRWLEWMVNEGGIESLETDAALYRLNLQMDRDTELREYHRETVNKVEKGFREARTPTEIDIARVRADHALTDLKDEAYRFEVEQLISRYSK